MSTMTPKIVMFNMEIGDAPEETSDGEEPSHNKLETMIKELSHALSGTMVYLIKVQDVINMQACTFLKINKTCRM